MRIHILGASGSGTTTLGCALSERLALPHFDTDDVFWLPSDPPYTHIRPVEERKRMLLDLVVVETKWVLSGSLVKWSDEVEELFTHIIFVSLDQAMRIQRLRDREFERYGERILAGGDMYASSQAFLGWANRYDSGRLDMRTRASQELWLQRFDCPILRLDSMESVETLVETTVRWLDV